MCAVAWIMPGAFAGETNHTFKLLNDRVTIRMPDTARIEALAPALMDAPASDEREMRVVYDRGEGRMVIMAHELFRLISKDYPDKELEDMKGLEGHMGPCELGKRDGGNVTYAYRKTAPEIEQDQTTYLYALVNIRHTDGTMLRLKLYFNPGFIKRHEECVELCRSVIDSVAAGSRALDLSERKVTLPTFEKGRQLEWTIPQGYGFYVEYGDGFYRATGNEVKRRVDGGSVFFMFLGDHPGTASRELDLKPSDAVKTITTSVLGRKLVWRCFETEDYVLTEAMMPFDVPTRQDEKIYMLFTLYTADVAGAEQLAGNLARLKEIRLPVTSAPPAALKPQALPPVP